MAATLHPEPHLSSASSALAPATAASQAAAVSHLATAAAVQLFASAAALLDQGLSERQSDAGHADWGEAVGRQADWEAVPVEGEV